MKTFAQLYTLGLVTILSPFTGIVAAEMYTQLNPIPSLEERKRADYRKEASIYEQSTGSNLEGKLNDQRFAIVLVDMQESFLQNIHPHERTQLIQEQETVLEAAAHYDIPVLVFEMDNFGKTIPELQNILKIVPRTKTFWKNRDDGFEIYESIIRFDPEYFPQDWLKKQGVDSLYFMGVNGNGCVEATANSAKDLFDLTIATSNNVIATSGKSSSTGVCAYESCDEAKASLGTFLEKGLLHQNTTPFLAYFREKKSYN